METTIAWTIRKSRLASQALPIAVSLGKEAKRAKLFSSWKSYSPFVLQMKALHNIEILVVRLDQVFNYFCNLY